MNGSIGVKLIDFNVSRRFLDESTNNRLLLMTNTGAAAFTAPEIHLKINYW